MNRIAVLLVTVPALFVLVRVGWAIAHPTWLARFVEHLAKFL